MANGHGGARKNAGKKKGTLWKTTELKLKMRQRLIERAYDKADQYFEAMDALALGHWRVIDNPVTGNPMRVYKKGPNGEALAYLLDQVIDKAVQHVDLGGSVETENKVTAETLAAIKQAVAYAIPKGTAPKKTKGKDSA